MRYQGSVAVMLIALGCMGCGEFETPPVASPEPDPAAAPDGPAVAAPQDVAGAPPQGPTPPQTPADQPGGHAAQPPQPHGQPMPPHGQPMPTGQPAAQPPTERVAADVGVGRKGRSLDDEDGVATRMIVEPAKSLFAFRERSVFQIQIPQAMQFFKASEGRGPRSHEEFMDKVIQAQQIRLPELPAGQRYVYDPETEELMVERPQ